jgi:hypothetical protein
VVDLAKLPALPPTSQSLDALGVPGLYALRQEIDARLPPVELSATNLIGELLLQYQVAKSLMAVTLTSEAVPANQKAQVLNSCTSVLEQVTRTQTALYNAERVKAIESALEKAFEHVPKPVKEAFYERYAKLLAEEVDRKKEKK